MSPLAWLPAALLAGIAAIAVWNALAFPRLGGRAPSPPLPRVSVLIPARDEAEAIGGALRSLQAQTYPAFEVVVLDDESRDGTAGTARAATAGDGRFRVLPGAPLPEGWLGKNWACAQLARAASGQVLLFTDADVRWQPRALAEIVAFLQATRADAVAVWPTQVTVSPAERLVVPLMAMAVLGYLPVVLVHHAPHESLCAAIGQCLVFRRAAYEAAGTHAAVRDRVLEDVLLMRLVKRAGLRLRMADAAGLVRCRMYRDWASVRDGFAKNILAGHADSAALLALSGLFHWALFVGPWAWAALAAATGRSAALPLALGAAGLGVRALTAAASGQRVRDALWLPVSIALMTVIAGRALQLRRRGGALWKGRALELPKSERRRKP